MKYHPDTSTLDPALAAEQMRILLEAYRILMDSEKRAIYDLRFKARKTSDGLSYRESLEKRRNDPYSRGLLIFYDLLNGSVNQAIFNYEKLLSDNQGNLDLLSLLGFADYLDFTFLLAEGYQRINRPQDAVRHYEDAYREDLKWNYFRHFRPELKQRIRNLYCRQLARQADPLTAIGYYKKLLEEYEFPGQERAFFHKKIAECHYRNNNLKEARDSLTRALEIKPNLSGTQKIRQHLRL